MKKLWSLAAVSALWTGVATAASTAPFAIDEYLSHSRLLASDLLREDAWRVLAATAVVYLLFWAVFRRILLKPVQEIDAHLYRIGTGRLEPLALHSHIRELQAIAGGVNLMVRRMEMNLAPHAIERFQDTIDKLRRLAHDLPARLCDDEANELLLCAATLESAFTELFQTASAEAALEARVS